MKDWDAIVIGGGPAGLTAGIEFAKAGRSVVIVERHADTPDGPGETLHPGIEAIFEKLGVGEDMRAGASARHDAVIVEQGRTLETLSYGSGWRGFQLRRRVLNRHLEAALGRLGGEVSRATTALQLESSLGHPIVRTSRGVLKGRWLLDASGMAGWLDRRLRTPMGAVSKPIWLRYGYRETTALDGPLPRLHIDDRRWFWRAPLGDGETAWVESMTGQPFGDRQPDARGADGTWRLSAEPAGPDMFRIGDAACRLDPSSGHGVLRAMMSGVLAAHLAILSEDGALASEKAVDVYNSWIRHWFAADVDHLRARLVALADAPMVPGC